MNKKKNNNMTDEELSKLAVDIAKLMPEKTFLTMCQAYMMTNMIHRINLELIPPAITSKKRQCYIRYEIENFKLPTPEEPYTGDTTETLGLE